MNYYTKLINHLTPQQMNTIEFTRINNDFNGNPRYVCHFLDFKPWQPDHEAYQRFKYEQALYEARKIGGKKFHNKQYGGGIVFQSYNIDGLEERILLSTGHRLEYHRNPTQSEINFGNGAIHYRSFDRGTVTNRKGELKKWFKSKDDKLNYSR